MRRTTAQQRDFLVGRAYKTVRTHQDVTVRRNNPYDWRAITRDLNLASYRAHELR